MTVQRAIRCARRDGCPCVCENGVTKPVEGLELTEATKAKILINIAELQAESQVVKAFVL